MDMLMFQLQKQSQTPLYKQLYREIKKAIIEGSIQVDTKLPSKRKLADYLQISQTTVELAYSQLVAEGFIESRPRKGFYAQPVEELAYLDIPHKEILGFDCIGTVGFSYLKTDVGVSTEGLPLNKYGLFDSQEDALEYGRRRREVIASGVNLEDYWEETPIRLSVIQI